MDFYTMQPEAGGKFASGFTLLEWKELQ